MKRTPLFALAVFLNWVSAADASVLGEKWCRLTADDITQLIGKQIRGVGRMAGSIFDAEIKNNTRSYAITEIEIEVIGTYDGGRPFRRTATQSVFLEPGESERVFFSVDSKLSYARIKLEDWNKTRLMGCLVD